MQDTNQEWSLIFVKLKYNISDQKSSDSDHLALNSEIVPVIDIFAKTTGLKGSEGDQKMLASHIDNRQVKDHVLWDRKSEALTQREESARRQSNKKGCRAGGLAPCQKHQVCLKGSIGKALISVHSKIRPTGRFTFDQFYSKCDTSD